MHRFLPLILVLLTAPAGCGHAAGSDPAAPSFPIPGYATSWLGNSFGGPDWVQRFSSDLYTAPDGTCYLATGWDEGGREYGIYKDGKVIGKADHTHGWGYGGGLAVTANGKYLFIAQQLSHMGKDDSAPRWPVHGTTWFGVGRRKLDGSLAPFVGAMGPESTMKGGGVFLRVNEVAASVHADLSGLAASASKLFVSDGYAAEVDVYDAESMAKIASWPLPRAGHSAYDAATDTLWIIQQGDAANPPAIRHFTSNGKAAGPDISLRAGAKPISLCMASYGRLLVGDNGPAQQILVYGNLAAAPQSMGTFGERGGIFSGTPGQVAPLKFATPNGVGTDAVGNIYVASYMGGTFLESYTPQGARNWELHGLEFVECADIDAASPNDVYTAAHHYVLDAAGAAGRDIRYTGYLIDRFAFPLDSRLHNAAGGSVFVCTIQGKKFLFGLDMNADRLQVYRFTGRGEMTAPSVAIRPSAWAKSYPAAQPLGKGWIWRDANGDGNFDANEFDSDTTNIPVRAWSIDTRGDVWMGYTTSFAKVPAVSIRRFPCQGLDAVGNPIYSFATAITAPAPAPFDDAKLSEIERMQYVAETDTMYLTGFTVDHPNAHRDWKTSGSVICRYDHWSKGPALRWEIAVPFESAQTPGSHHATPDAISIAGDRLFNGYLAHGEIRVYDTADGRYLGSLLPGPEVDKSSGWIDTMYGVRAARLADGEYLVFAEEDYHEKILVYRMPHS